MSKSAQGLAQTESPGHPQFRDPRDPQSFLPHPHPPPPPAALAPDVASEKTLQRTLTDTPTEGDEAGIEAQELAEDRV